MSASKSNDLEAGDLFQKNKISFWLKMNTFYSYSMHKATITVIVVDRFMPCGPIIPHGYITFLPTDAALKFWLFTMLLNHIKYGIGFFLTKPLNMNREYGIDI